jgi:ribosomal protection tetracycline resistance protein
VAAGEIAQVHGLRDVRIGDTLGTPAATTPAARFAPPTLPSVVVPARTGDGRALHSALTELADQDPPINLTPDLRISQFFPEAPAATFRSAPAEGCYGWPVTDIRVTATRTGFVSPSTTAADFRKLLPLVLARALAEAGTVVCEPIHRFHLEGPAETLGPVLGPLLGALSRAAAVPNPPEMRGAAYVIGGLIPAARLRELEQALPGLTHGEGVLESVFEDYRAVSPPYPVRPGPVRQ